MSVTNVPTPLQLKGCTLTALSTGEEATSLRELRDRIRRVPERSLYYHFWGRFLRPVRTTHDFVNDFGNWVGNQLRDRLLAERLALVDPGDETDLETLRDRVADLLEERLADGAPSLNALPDEAFHFLEGQIVIFDTGQQARDPVELARLLPRLPESSIYYHLIDARHRSPPGQGDEFQRWLSGWGEPFQPLVDVLKSVDVYFTSLADLQGELAELFRQHVLEVDP